MMKMSRIRLSFSLCALLLVLPTLSHAQQITIDFEGLLAMTYAPGNAVPNSAKLSNQLAMARGVVFSSESAKPYVAVVDLGNGHATSGVNGIGGVDANNVLSYSVPVRIRFVLPGNPAVDAVTDFVSIRGDQWPTSGGPVTLEAFDISGTLLGSDTQIDNQPVVLSVTCPGIHSIRITESSGTVALDDLTFHTPVAASSKPVKVQIIPEAHYHLANMVVNGQSVGLTNNYVFDHVRGTLTITAFCQIDQHTLRVASAHGQVFPAVGLHTYRYGTKIACQVPRAQVTEHGTQYVCVGWTGTGSVPANGTTNKVSFTLSRNSTITWRWQTLDEYLRPVIASIRPASGYTTTNATVRMQIVARSRVRIANVTVNSHAAQSSGINTWTYRASLSLGTNPFTVRVTDNAGRTATGVVQYIRSAPLVGESLIYFSMLDTAGGNYHLFTARPDPANPNTQSVPMNNSSGDQCYPVVSPNGRFVLYSGRITASPVYQLWVLDRTTGERRFLLDGLPEDWHPSGQRFVYVSNDYCSEAIHEAFVSVTSTGLVVTTTRLLFDSDRPAGPCGVQYSPDGRRITFTYCPNYCSYYDMEIYVGSLEGTLPIPESSITRLTTNSWFDYAPHWTPDSRQIIWMRLIDDSTFEVRRKNADGSGPDVLVTTLSGGYEGDFCTPPVGYTGPYIGAFCKYTQQKLFLLRTDGSQDVLDIGALNITEWIILGLDWVGMTP